MWRLSEGGCGGKVLKGCGDSVMQDVWSVCWHPNSLFHPMVGLHPFHFGTIGACLLTACQLFCGWPAAV